MLPCLSLFSQQAWASKARIDSLQGARFIRDAQTVFVNPAHLNSLEQQFTVEFGDTSNAASPKAEGGLFLDKFGGKIGAYLGHMNTVQKRIRDNEAYFLEKNPVEILAGFGKWGGAVYYSRSEERTAEQSQETLGGRLGFADGRFEAFLSLDGIARSTKAPGSQFKMKFPSLMGGVEYALGDYYLFAETTYAASEQRITTPLPKNAAEVVLEIYEAGVVDRSLSVGGRTFYFGVSAKYDRLRKDTKSNHSFTIPIVIGIEKAVNQWADVRASLLQNVPLGFVEDNTATAPNNKRNTPPNNTTVAAGLGLKFEGFQVDATAEAATSGDINTTNLLAKGSVAYRF